MILMVSSKLEAAAFLTGPKDCVLHTQLLLRLTRQPTVNSARNGISPTDSILKPGENELSLMLPVD